MIKTFVNHFFNFKYLNSVTIYAINIEFQISDLSIANALDSFSMPSLIQCLDSGPQTFMATRNKTHQAEQNIIIILAYCMVRPFAIALFNTCYLP